MAGKRNPDRSFKKRGTVGGGASSATSSKVAFATGEPEGLSPRHQVCESWLIARKKWPRRWWTATLALWYTGSKWRGIGKIVKLTCIAWIAAYPILINWAELQRQPNAKDKIFPIACMSIGILCATFVAYFDKFWKEKKAPAAEKKALREASYRLGHSVTMLAEVVSFNEDGGSKEKIKTVIERLCEAIRNAIRSNFERLQTFPR